MAIDQQSRLYFNKPLSNIVFMGMGEPLMNYNNVVAAIEKITAPSGMGVSAKRITLSTSGVPKMIKKLAEEYPKFKLAVSLHSARQEVRQNIMPFADKFPLEDLLDSLQFWYEITNSRITFEYVVWEGINDTQEDIQALVDYCQKVPSKVNLIQYNNIGEDQFQKAPKAVVELYQKVLEANGIVATIRRSRGSDIDAACGQLANKSQA